MAENEYTPTTEQVRGIDPFFAEYFDRWLAAHDAQVRAEALEKAADAYDNDITLYADIERRSLGSNGRDVDSIQDIGVAWLRARAAAIRTTPTETTSGDSNEL